MSIDPSTNHHKGFCFIEFELPEGAFIARETMNGRLFGGRNIKVLPVGRQDTMPQAQPIIDMVMNEARQYNRVYVSSVHPDISEQDLRSVFMAFGEVTKCQLARHPSGKGHRGFGYIEFRAANSVNEAIEGMSGFDLGGQFLQVGRAVAPPDAINYLSGANRSDANSALPAAAAIAAAEATARITAQEILGIGGKTSPGSSPSGYQTPSSPTPPPITEAQKSAAATETTLSQAAASVGGAPTSSRPTAARRRGFGGFAGAAIMPPPSIVQALPATTTTPPQAVPDGLESPRQQQQQEQLADVGVVQPPATLGVENLTAMSTVFAPQLVIPTLGGGSSPFTTPAAAAAIDVSTSQEDPAIDDFYSTLKDEQFAPPPPKIIAATEPTTTTGGVSLLEQLIPTSFEYKKKAASSSKSGKTATTKTLAPIALADGGPSASIGQQQNVPKKAKKEKRNMLDRIGEKAHIGTFDASKPASFAPLDPNVAPKDPNAVDSDGI
uniref:RRM domain-containing protein n=1 Tax=Globodera pallida TaxID=36090 RepID=A0A183BMI2_GLOPA